MSLVMVFQRQLKSSFTSGKITLTSLATNSDSIFTVLTFSSNLIIVMGLAAAMAFGFLDAELRLSLKEFCFLYAVLDYSFNMSGVPVVITSRVVCDMHQRRAVLEGTPAELRTFIVYKVSCSTLFTNSF